MITHCFFFCNTGLFLAHIVTNKVYLLSPAVEGGQSVSFKLTVFVQQVAVMFQWVKLEEKKNAYWLVGNFCVTIDK